MTAAGSLSEDYRHYVTATRGWRAIRAEVVAERYVLYADFLLPYEAARGRAHSVRCAVYYYAEAERAR